MIDGERGYRKVNQGSTETMSTTHASVTKWRREKSRAGRENVAKSDLWKEEIRERDSGGGGGEYVMKERRAFNVCAASVERGERWAMFPCASTSTLLIHHSHLGL